MAFATSLTNLTALGNFFPWLRPIVDGLRMFPRVFPISTISYKFLRTPTNSHEFSRISTCSVLFLLIVCLESVPVIKGFIEGLLPQIIIILFFFFLVPIIKKLGDIFYKPTSNSELDVIVMQAFFTFR